MSWATAEQMLLEASKSPELAAALQIVADAEAGGAPKYAPRATRELGRVIVCRSYGPAVLELCHLIVAVEALVDGASSYEDFFWNSGPATAAGFRAHVARCAAQSASETLTVTDAGLECTYPDGRFTVTYARMPFLSALVEFLITTIGYGDLDDVVQSLLSQGPSKARVSASANALSKRVYGYLKAHLTGAQAQRKFACLTAYLTSRGAGDFGPEPVDDATVLDFWLAQPDLDAGRGADFKMFLSVLRGFVRLRQALDAARDLDALRGPRSIGPDRAAGEVDPGEVLHMVEGIDDEADPLEMLAEGPVRSVKFLTKTEAAGLELLVECGKVAEALPLSLLRGEVFGPSQARISQALRRKVENKALHAVIEDSFGESYDERRAGIEALARHLESVLLASLHVLVRARRREALSLILDIEPDIDLRPLAKVLIEDTEDVNVVPLRGAEMADRLMDAIEDPAVAGPGLATLMTRASKAFRGLTRLGFRRTDLDDPECIEGFAAGTAAVLSLKGQLEAFRRTLGRMPVPQGDWKRQFDTDRNIFRDQFMVLYGEAL